MSVKKVIGKIHLWLGLVSGLVVFVVALSGCILAFEQEIKHSVFPYLTSKTQENAKLLPPSKLMEIAAPHVPGKQPNFITYLGRDKSASVMFYGSEPVEYYYQVFIDPYTGEVKKVWNEDEDFFHTMVHLHYNLLLPIEIGQQIVAGATLVFVIMLISGLVLWWPKNKSAAKQRFSIKWKAQWRRLNYDLHNVLGFYMMAIGLVLALTGLVWGYAWFSNALYYATSGGKQIEDRIFTSDKSLASTKIAQPLDVLFEGLVAKSTKDEGIFFSPPLNDSATLSAGINHRPGTYYKQDVYTYDQYTLKPVPRGGVFDGEYASSSFADKLRRMNYDIHVGAILGLPGKILMFLASLICASMPITGIYIWWGRKYKTKKKPAARTVPQLAKA
ncbi:PepSY domain-containing protein [Chitinophaga horti]|uniref:PepSY domain-containing protein n=1 Tax=Chitinophaga horti TaxID=2920382 RepID=A0ABY6J2L8_9BACT|nr:PepSY-associated TM helix domain-containing protein [Chitinophaga horti]UYQ93646.1 PepSY domain-containing protein [Chitinophaga horti]